MASYFSADITFLELQNGVLQELREPVNIGSEAVPMDMVKDKIRAVYAEVFNDQRIKPSARENNVSFLVSEDTTLGADCAAAATSLTLADTSTWRTAGKLLMGSNIITYTGNDGVNTLSGVTGVDVLHYSGEVCRQLYPLSSIASDIEAEQVNYLDIGGIPQHFMAYDNLLNAVNFYPNAYSVYKGHLIFSRQSTIGGNAVRRQCLLIYTQQVVLLSGNTDKPTLIPNSWRTALLVYGACMKIAAADSFRTSWDWWTKEYEKALSQYVAFKNNRVRDINNKRRPSVYSAFGMFR